MREVKAETKDAILPSKTIQGQIGRAIDLFLCFGYFLQREREREREIVNYGENYNIAKYMGKYFLSILR